MRNLAAARTGTIGRFIVVHMIVPAGLRPPGTEPRTFCGWAFANSRHTDYNSEFLEGEVCDKCLQGLHAKVAARRRALAAATAADLPVEAPSPRELDGGGCLPPPSGAEPAPCGRA